MVAPSAHRDRLRPPLPSTAGRPCGSAIPPGWPDVASAVTTHDAWGVRADHRRSTPRPAARPARPITSCGAPRPQSAGVETATVGRSGDPVVDARVHQPARRRDAAATSGSGGRPPPGLARMDRCGSGSAPSPRRRRCCSSGRGRIGGALAPWDPGRVPGRPRGRRRHPSHVRARPGHARGRAAARAVDAGPARRRPSVSWAEVASAISSHDSWGVRVVTVDQRGFNPAQRTVVVSRALVGGDADRRRRDCDRRHLRRSAVAARHHRAAAPRGREQSGSGASTGTTSSSGSTPSRSPRSPAMRRCCSSGPVSTARL